MNMKKRKSGGISVSLVFVVLFLSHLCITHAFAKEESPSAEISLSPMTKYVWRGQEMTRGSIVIQSSMMGSYKGFTVSLWGNLDTHPYSSTDKSYTSTWTETDLTIYYSKTFGSFIGGVGYIYYGLSPANKDAPDPPDSQELFVTLSWNTFLVPTITIFKEIDHYHQWYMLLGISHIFEINKYISVKVSASASYLKSEYADAALFNAGTGYGGYPKFNDQAMATDEKYNNFHDGMITISLPISATKNFTVTPTVSFVFPLSGDAKNEMKGRGIKNTATPAERESSFLYGGLSLTFSF